MLASQFANRGSFTNLFSHLDPLICHKQVNDHPKCPEVSFNSSDNVWARVRTYLPARVISFEDISNLHLVTGVANRLSDVGGYA